jgi:hypothetical protein
MIQHRQVEPAAVPRHELRRILLDAVEEATDELGLGVGRVADRPDADSSRIAQRAGDRDDLLQIMRREVVTRRCSPLLREPGEHGGVVDARTDVVDAAYSRDVGHRLDVEDEQRRHRRRGRFFAQSVQGRAHAMDMDTSGWRGAPINALDKRFRCASRNPPGHAGNTPVDR